VALRGGELMTTRWKFESAASGESSNTLAGVSTTVTPAVGDLMLMWWGANHATSAFTSVGIADTGSGGWSAPFSFITATTRTGFAWWKVAESADYNGGSGISITVTGSGGAGTVANNVQCDIWRPPSLAVPFLIGGGNTTPTNTNTSSWATQSPLLKYTFLADTLATTCIYSTGSIGALTGTNDFVGVNTVNLALCLSGNDTLLCAQGAGGIQQAANTGSTFTNSWSTSRTVIAMGLVFGYTNTTGQFLEFE
jgi:hypothetical protein